MARTNGRSLLNNTKRMFALFLSAYVTVSLATAPAAGAIPNSQTQVCDTNMQTAKIRRAIVFGSTGATGKQLVADLARNNWEVTAVVRKVTDIQATFPALTTGQENVKPTVVDYENLDLQAAAIAGHDAAFCVLGTTHAIAGSRDAFSRVDGHYVTEAARVSKAGGIPVFVLLTSTGVRDWIPRWMSNYLYTKAQAEHGVREQKFEHAAVFRPGFLVREDTDRWEERLASNIMSGLPVANLARAMRLKAEQFLSGSSTEEFEIVEGNGVIEDYVRRTD